VCFRGLLVSINTLKLEHHWKTYVNSYKQVLRQNYINEECGGRPGSIMGYTNENVIKNPIMLTAMNRSQSDGLA
jgi:hypothetical protein